MVAYPKGTSPDTTMQPLQDDYKLLPPESKPLPPESQEESRILKEDGKCLIRLCPPRSTRPWDIFIVFTYHMLPFTAAPILLTIFLFWFFSTQFGVNGFIGMFSFTVFCVFSPLIYDRKYRKKLEHLYVSMARYMTDVKILVPAKPFPNQGAHVFAFHPHGRMFYTISLMIQTHETWRASFLPGGDFFTAAASGFFYYPILRHFLYTIGAMPANKQNIVARLRQKNHVAIIVGGVKEVCLGTSPDVDELYLQNRKGFIKLAMQEKTGVVPVYCFNENQLFCHDHKAKLKFWEKVNNFVNVGVPGMRGVFGLTMPFQRELMVVVGDPLYAKEGETVEEFHARYVDALEKLFQRYVPLSPNPKHKLVIT